MGVKGLWSVLDEKPNCRHPIKYESLKGQRLAVDASIWLYQLSRVKGASPSSIPAGIFRRLAKLHYFGVLPVFVFDGLPPLLKRSELKRRADQRIKAERDVKQIARKILKTKLKLLAAGCSITGSEGNKEQLKDMFQLKPLEISALEDEDSSEYSEEDSAILDEDQLYAQVDIDSPSFKSLPDEVQLEILYQLKERLYLTQNPNIYSLEDHSFAQSQIASIQKRHRITSAIDALKKRSFAGDDGIKRSVQKRRIVSTAERSFVLVKNESHGYTFVSGESAHLMGDDSGIVTPKIPVKVKEEEESEDDDAFLAKLLGDHDEPQLQLIQSKETIVTEPVGLNGEHDVKTDHKELVSTKSDHEEPLDSQSDHEDTRLLRESVPLQIVEVDDEETETVERANLVEDKTVTVEGNILNQIDKKETVVPEQIIVAEPLADDNLHEDANTELITETSEQNITMLQDELVQLRKEHQTASANTEGISSEQEAMFKNFLDAFGYPWMVAIGEAEAQCASMYLTGAVDGVITDDVDVFLFGGDRVYRHFFRPKHDALLYSIEGHWRRSDLIIAALFLGGDYGPGVNGYGPKKTMQLLDHLPSDDIEVNVRELRIRLNTNALSDAVIDAYQNPSVEVFSHDRLRWGTPDRPKLKRFLVNKAKWREQEAEKALFDLLRH